MVMSKILKISLLIILFIVIIVAGIFIYQFNKLDLSPIIKTRTVEFPELNETLYIRAMAWGLTADHNEIILSTEPILPENRNSEKDKDYIFYTPEIYYKKSDIDTLLIYADKSSIGNFPLKFTSNNIKIAIKEINDYDESIDYKSNYNKYGLEKLSVYE
jgi:hypothetical protein